MSAPTPKRGTVVAFDEAVGLGTVQAAGVSYPFHCTQIADGSRRIDAGTTVSFTLLAGRNGTWEAAGVTPA